ncbi:MAG: YbbR-like domain-containing protein [Blastocatellia bacterium]|nr:YbbR-like domain-containing protein [Chloracidobacterium sp.]MBL8183668.1 YbbR-like domain-containing protein [Blastocatellia bacterium]HBE82890.1 hypothetical protein [Blastocatellia bacterium]HRJ87915.1 CdaR family protein [Pyrinomonadaceae bacterium]HRK51842.1 CdaR family protein [Pyrinomonadaceae bacterium]
MTEVEERGATKEETYGLLIKQVVRKVFFEDWLIKLVALGVTFSLWLGVTGLSTPTTTRFSSVPLTLRFASNTEITNSPVQEVDIVVTGDKRRINQINKNDLILSVDLTDVQPGDRVIQLTPEDVSIELPTGVKLDEIQPNRIAVRLEPVEEREVDVKIETDGELTDGLEVYAQTAVPARVRVRGPASFVRQLTVVSAEKIDLKDRRGDFVAKQIPLVLANPKAAVLDSTVDISFRIGEKRIERLLLVPVKGDARRKATVVLFGPRSALLAAKPDDLEVNIIGGAADDDTSQLTLPSGLRNDVEIRKFKIAP